MRALWLAALTTAACTQGPPAEAPPPLVRGELAPGGAAAAAGETRFAVRASRDGLPVAAACEATGGGFVARFTAPAQVAAPSFGGSSGSVRVVCEADGRRGARLLQPTLRSMGGGGVAPVIGVGVSTGGDMGVSLGGWWGGWGAPQSTSVRYPDVEVPLD